MKFSSISGFLALSFLLALPGLASASNWGLTTAARLNSGGQPASVVSADFNHDGFPDLVTVPNKNNGAVFFFPGKGDGKFGKKLSFKPTTNDLKGNPVYIVMGDFNKDGNMDIAVAFFDNKAKTNPGKVEVFLGRSKAEIALSADGWPFKDPVPYPAGIRPVSIATADFNGDGILDLAAANFGDGKDTSVGTISVFLGNKDGLGNPDGTFSTPVVFPAGVNPRQIVAVSPVPGTVDLAVTNMDADANTFSILNGNGDGTFNAPTAFPMPDERSMPWGIAAADLDGDGRLDFVVTESGKKRVEVFYGKDPLVDPVGLFEPAVKLDAINGPDFVLITDINQDGKPDLLVAEGGSNALSVFMNKGARTFDTRKDFGAGTFPLSLAISDLNRDGDPDIATADNKSGGLSVLLARVTGKGTWGFANPAVDFPGAAWPKGLTAGAFTNATTVTADFNRDGVPDTAALDKVNNAVLVSITGAVGGPVSYPVGNNASAIIAADINRDGKPDIAVANQTDGTVSVLLGNGDGTFQTTQNFTVGLDPASMAVGDFGDPNGWQDIAVSAGTPAADGDGLVSVLFGQEQFEITIQVAPEGGGTVAKVIDINDDSKDVVLSPGPHTFGFGEEVTLREKEATGFSFKSWSGGAGGTGTTNTFTVKTKMTIKATFTAAP